MKEFAQKLQKLERSISKDKGPFLLFALFLSEDSPDLWDLLVSAEWIDKSNAKALRYLAQKLREVATPEEILKLSRIAIIEGRNPALRAMQSAIRVKHGLAEVQNCTFFGLQIKHGFIITSQKDAQQGATSKSQM